MKEEKRLSAQARWLFAKMEAVEEEIQSVPQVAKQEHVMDDLEAGSSGLHGGTKYIDDMEDVITRVHKIVAEHQTAAWRAVLSHIVTQLARAGVVAAELWTRTKTIDGDVELHRAPGGFYADHGFYPPLNDEESFEKIQSPQPPNVPGMGLAGIHWSVGVDLGEGDNNSEGGSHHGGNKFTATGTISHDGRRVSKDHHGGSHDGRRVSKDHHGRRRRFSREGDEHDDWEWKRLDYMIDNPDLIFDDHARHVAKVFGLVHLVKFQSKTDDFGGVIMLYTSKAAIENGKALEHASARTFGHTIPRLITSNIVTIPFQLNLGAILNEVKDAADQAAYVILWVVSGGLPLL